MKDGERYYTKTIKNSSLNHIPEKRHWCPKYDTRPGTKTGTWVLLCKDWKGTYTRPAASS